MPNRTSDARSKFWGLIQINRGFECKEKKRRREMFSHDEDFSCLFLSQYIMSCSIFDKSTPGHDMVTVRFLDLTEVNGCRF
jgi:hypothetical protein